MMQCPNCEGCGKIDDGDDGAPWTFWLNLPLKSAGAVLMGLVRPIKCPACQGTGEVPEPKEENWNVVYRTGKPMMWIVLFIVGIAWCLTAHAAEISYPAAYSAYQQGQPMVLVIGANWCPACRALRASLRASDVPFVALDDNDAGTAYVRRVYYSGGAIPQVVVCVPRGGLHFVRRIVGGSVEAVRRLRGP